MRSTRALVLPFIVLLLVVPIAGQEKPYRIGEIEFFGYGGIDIAPIRAGLPLREGGEISETEILKTKEEFKKAITQTRGLVPTDVEVVCCDQGGVMIYIGLPGSSSQKIRLNPAPHGSKRLPKEIVDLYEQASNLLMESVRTNPGEDRSKGYALSSYEPLREKQLAMRKWAKQHSVLLRQVLASSADANQRAVAAQVLGYGLQSREQIVALSKASRDQHETVRNNATRALGVLVESNSRLMAWIPAANFVAMLNSGIWKDRNKAGLLLEVLTRRREPGLLKLLRANALDSLIEMARWRSPGHASNARTILGRIAGIEEKHLQEMISSGQSEVIINSARGLR